jgi:hypothetical protein
MGLLASYCCLMETVEFIRVLGGKMRNKSVDAHSKELKR